MSKRAWTYISSIVLAGAALSVLALPGAAQSTSQWLTFAVLTLLATLAQLFKARAPGHQSYHPTLVFLFAGVLLLHPFLLALLVIIPHVIEWAKERLVDSPRLRSWYLQPFNIAMHIISGSAARWVCAALGVHVSALLTPLSIMSVSTAAMTYVLVNHLLTGMALVLARGVSWRESGVLYLENLVTDLILLLVGHIVAVLWKLNSWLIPPALSPLVLMYRALMIPQLKREAQTDEKTGLLNARHFSNLFKAELARAKRFDHSLAVIMGDLDLLRNINNTYGHLAGDAVLAGVGRITRASVHEYDIAARFGGEEFCIVLPEVGPAEAQSFAERLRGAIESASFEVTTSATPIRATMSFGVACFPSDAMTYTELIHEADVAVYQAKLQGRNRVVRASEVPRSLRLESGPIENRLSAPYLVPFVPRLEPAAAETPDNDAAAVTVQAKGPANSHAAASNHPRELLWLLVGAVTAVGVGLTILGFFLSPRPDWAGICLFVVLAAVTQVLQSENLYGESSVSVSVGVNFAAALTTGLVGTALVSAVIAVVHNVQRRPRWYKTAFNWASHVLAGSAPALTISTLAISLQVRNVPLLAIPISVSGLAYYIIETGLIAGAISLSERSSLMATWQERYRWLAEHYVVLCIIALFLGTAYISLGPLGVLVFTLPLLMMHYAQKQYVGRSQRIMREVQRMNEELTLANREVMGATYAIQQMNDELLLTLAKTVDARDPYVSGHSAQVARYATLTATELGLPREHIEQVRKAALLHDIGKIGISDRVLRKPGLLSDEEYEYFKDHARLGAEFLHTCQTLQQLAPIVRHHHERWDGGGYPDGLRREQIPLEARILAVCDAIDAMASDRPYRRAMPLADVVAELGHAAGRQFDPVVVEAFVRVAEHEGDHLVVNSAHEVVQRRPDNGDLIAHVLPALTAA